MIIYTIIFILQYDMISYDCSSIRRKSRQHHRRQQFIYNKTLCRVGAWWRRSKSYSRIIYYYYLGEIWILLYSEHMTTRHDNLRALAEYNMVKTVPKGQTHKPAVMFVGSREKRFFYDAFKLFKYIRRYAL